MLAPEVRPLFVTVMVYCSSVPVVPFQPLVTALLIVKSVLAVTATLEVVAVLLPKFASCVLDCTVAVLLRLRLTPLAAVPSGRMRKLNVSLELAGKVARVQSRLTVTRSTCCPGRWPCRRCHWCRPSLTGW